MVKAIEYGLGHHAALPVRLRQPSRNLLRQYLVRPREIEVVDVLTQYSRQMLLISDEKMIQTLLADAAQEPLTMRVQFGVRKADLMTLI